MNFGPVSLYDISTYAYTVHYISLCGIFHVYEMHFSQA